MDAGAGKVDFDGQIRPDGVSLDGTLSVSGLDAEANVTGALYSQSRTRSQLEASGMPVPRVATQTSSGAWTFPLATAVAAGDWYVAASADTTHRLAGLDIDLSLRAGKINGTAFAATDGQLQVGNNAAQLYLDMTAKGVFTLSASGGLQYDIRGSGDLQVSRYDFLSAELAVTPDGASVSGRYRMGTAVDVELAGAICRGPCPSLIADTRASASTALNIELSGEGDLSVRGFDIDGAFELRRISTGLLFASSFTFDGGINSAVIAADVSGGFDLYADAPRICAAGSGELKTSAPRPSGTIEFCTNSADGPRARIDFRRGDYRFAGNISASSFDMSVYLDDEVTVWPYHRPCHPGWDECRDFVEYTIRGRIRFDADDDTAPRFVLSASGDGTWKTRLRKADNSADGWEYSTVTNFGVGIDTDPWGVCVTIAGAERCASIDPRDG